MFYNIICKKSSYCSNILSTLLVCWFFPLYSHVTAVTFLDVCSVIFSEQLRIVFLFFWILKIKKFAMHKQNPFITKIVFHQVCMIHFYIWCLLLLTTDYKFVHKLTKISSAFNIYSRLTTNRFRTKLYLFSPLFFQGTEVKVSH